jgi:pimeloyl-ACP methyl ester carboxylesterase
VWDIRRMLLWLREQDALPVGVLGHSLGGYVAALLCALDEGIECVIVGNPAVDPSRLFWGDALSLATRYLKSEGVREEAMGELLRVVSPLAFAPGVPRANRAIFAGVADRVVPAVEASSLWRHWEKPRIAWYQGTHRGFLRAPEGRSVLTDTLRACGLLPEDFEG